MDKELCYNLGHITKAHGSKGDVVAFFDVDTPHRYAKLPSVYVDMNGELTPFFIQSIQALKERHFRIRFEDVESMEAASPLLKKDLYLPLDQLPEKSGKQFYYHEVIGFEVIDGEKGAIGTIEQVVENPANPLLELKYGEHRILLPINDEVIQSVDRMNQTMHVSAPEGLIDLYLGT